MLINPTPENMKIALINNAPNIPREKNFMMIFSWNIKKTQNNNEDK